MEDEILLKRISRGDENAFEELYEKYSQPIFNFILRIIKDIHKSEEICQEVFLRVFTHAGKFKPTAKVSTWMYQIARNLSLNELRNKARHKEESLDEKAEFVSSTETENILKEKNLQERISVAVSNLSEEHHTVFTLKHEQDLSYEEIAKIMNCLLGTVKSRMYFAIRSLREQLKDLL